MREKQREGPYIENCAFCQHSRIILLDAIFLQLVLPSVKIPTQIYFSNTSCRWIVKFLYNKVTFKKFFKHQTTLIFDYSLLKLGFLFLKYIKYFLLLIFTTFIELQLSGFLVTTFKRLQGHKNSCSQPSVYFVQYMHLQC